MDVWYDLSSQHGNEKVVSVRIENDLCGKTMFSSQDTELMYEADIGLKDCLGKRQGEDVIVYVELDLFSYTMTLQVNDESWYPVAETSDALCLRAHLLKYIHTLWRSPENTESIGPDAHRILRNSAEEILRIQQK